MKMILVSHSDFAKGALAAAKMIAGVGDNVVALGLTPEDDLDTFSAKIEAEIERMGADEEYIIFSDLYFGSPCNSVVKIMQKYKIHHITGMNLPLIIETSAMLDCGMSADELASSVVNTAREGVIDLNEQLKGN